jgi:starch-binding outer membrane protein, SusD/RagB family
MKACKSILLALLCFLAAACQGDYFELERPPQNPWGTLEEFERAPIGVYASIFGGHHWNVPWVNHTVVKNSMGDDVNWVSNGEWGYWRKTKEFNIYTDKNILLLYRTISAANNALEFVESNNGNPYPGETAEAIANNLTRIVGELHFVRAYAYYLLQTTFGEAYVPNGKNDAKRVPMPTRYAKSIDEARNPKIGNAQEVFDLILADLQKAKTLLPESFNAKLHHPSYQVRATRFAASAMLMRTYFQMGNYAKAKDECNYLIDQNGGEFDLSEDPIQAFNKSSLARGREVIFYAPYYDVTLPAPNHLSVLNHTWDGKQCNWPETRMAEGTIRRLGWMNDPQRDTAINLAAKRDKRFTQLLVVRYPVGRAKSNQTSDNRNEIKSFTTIWCNKYFRGANQMNTNVPLIRLAEVYLTRSICRFLAGERSGAADDLNVVRKRAWDTSAAGPYVPISAAQISAEIIHEERLIELWNEGDRIDYLRGLKVDIPRGERGPGVDPYTHESFVWAMPVRETLYNLGFVK